MDQDDVLDTSLLAKFHLNHLNVPHPEVVADPVAIIGQEPRLEEGVLSESHYSHLSLH